MPRPKTLTPEILTAALEGFALRQRRLEEQIAYVRKMLGLRADVPLPLPAPTRRKYRFSAAARKRIAAAQKKRWAEWRKKGK